MGFAYVCSMMKTLVKTMILLAIAALMTACGTLDTAYIPEKVGRGSDPVAQDGIYLQLIPPSDTVEFGEPITFCVKAVNVGEKAVYLPRKPELLFIWVYANGTRDNHIMELSAEKSFLEDELVRIEPGQSMRYEKIINTYYFPALGITEFSALLNVPVNQNNEIGPVWSGRARSNRYAMLIDEPQHIRQYAEEQAQLQASMMSSVNRYSLSAE